MHKILIVDDDPLIQLLLQEILREYLDHNIDLLTADNGINAIETIKKENPDIVFLDVMMPNMNGFEVCNIVKNKLKMKNVYIIMLTAKGQELDKQKASEIGADFYITKPFSIDKVINKTREILATRLQ